MNAIQLIQHIQTLIDSGEIKPTTKVVYHTPAYIVDPEDEEMVPVEISDACLDEGGSLQLVA